ncbi:lachesin-like isoform X1 [Haliotis rufescens]|uniref:lachesin-like isoform X1 n=1 Tax=Haliotis rufescens TaxID=6454 RepID=UPI001EAFA5EF|nr:lachesin-like isoform X1 [Haliotis rufescens]
MFPWLLLNLDITGSLLLIINFLGLDAVTFEPSFDVPMVNVTVKQGTTAILPCSVKFLGQHQVVWTDQWSTLLTFEDRRIIDDERLSVERPYTTDWNLHIRTVRHNDQGIYNCQVNTSPVKIKTVNLKVQVPAEIINKLSSDDVTAREGDTVTLVCNVTGIPMPTVTWHRHKSLEKDDVEKESEFCPGTNRIGVSGEVLIIHNVSRYCGGTYECVAFNGVPPAVNRHINVAVEFPPEIRLPNKRIGQALRKETILECIVTAFPQEITIWTREGVQITNSFKYRVEIYAEEDHTIILSLRIRDLDYRDFGDYTCKASNRLGQDEERMNLYEYLDPKKPTTTLTPSTTPSMSEVTTVSWKFTRTYPPEVDSNPGNTVIIQPDSLPRPTQIQTDQIPTGNQHSDPLIPQQHSSVSNGLCTGSFLPVCTSGHTLASKNAGSCCQFFISFLVITNILTFLYHMGVVVS